MRTNLAARIGLATVVAVGSLALIAGPAAAAVPAPVPCSAIPGTIATLELRVEVAQERLETATPSQKHDLILLIIRLQSQIHDLEVQLAHCPA
jgi:hypothetical protein